MNEYNITDYSAFETATATTKELNNAFENAGTEITACKSVTSNESVFMGPIADDCNSTLDKLSVSSKEIVDNFTTLSQHLTNISSTYQKGDKDSLDAIMSITSGESSAAGILSGSMIEQYKQLAQLQTGGHFENSKYTATNGVTLKYYLYVPDFKDGTHTGLPLCVFLHGTGGADGAMGESFPKAVKNGMNVPGYLLFPQSSKNWSGQVKAQDAAVELTRKIAKEKNCDMTRISAAGHSNGGYGVHQMVANHTDLFSSYLSYAGGIGSNTNVSAITNAKIYSWGFHGTNDSAVNYSNGQNAYKKLEAGNPNGVEFTALKKGKHPIASDFWITPYSFNGTTISPIEWLFTTKKYGT